MATCSASLPGGAPRTSDARGRSGTITSATLVRVNDHFFVAEPQVDALWRIASWLRLDAGVGYRAIGGADLLQGS